MSYLVLARKFRPQTFDEIVGQQHVTRTLTNAITSDRVAHAYLFTGTRGVGKTTAARVLAKALNCVNGPTPTPCNECVNCKAITRGNCVDVFEIDGASNTGVDDVRELRENVRFMPQTSKYKIYIVDEVHMLSTSAFNALLKTLEEPPDHVVFIFATTESHKIPNTVLSRCQQYDFKMIPQRMIFDHIKVIVEKENVNLDDSALRLIARKADGSMRDAMSNLDQVLSFGGEKITAEDLLEVLGVVDRQVLMDLSKAIISGGAEGALEVLQRLQGTTWDVKQFYGDLLEHFRNLIVTKVSENPENMIDTTVEEIDELKSQVTPASLETFQRLFDILVENEDLVIRSGNPRLVLEMTLLRMAYAAPILPLDTLIEKLAELKKAVALGGATSKVPFLQGKKSGEPKAPPPAPAPAKDKKPEPTPVTGSLAERFIAKVRSENGTLAIFFEKAKQMESSDTKIVFGFDDQFLLDKVNESQAEYQAAFESVSDKKATLSLVLLEKENTENEWARQKRERAEATQRLSDLRKESRKHEVVKKVLEIFDNTDLTVKPIDNKNH
jgi:DNA polymerase-3 subunit gamma/tau